MSKVAKTATNCSSSTKQSLLSGFWSELNMTLISRRFIFPHTIIGQYITFPYQRSTYLELFPIFSTMALRLHRKVMFKDTLDHPLKRSKAREIYFSDDTNGTGSLRTGSRGNLDQLQSIEGWLLARKNFRSVAARFPRQLPLMAACQQVRVTTNSKIIAQLLV